MKSFQKFFIFITVIFLMAPSLVLAVEDNKGLIRKALPDCLFENTWSEAKAKGCADISIFVETLIGVGGVLFSVIGGLALVMFVYGGFVLILSQGNSEKVKKGTEIMVAAIIGLVVAFGGYMLVRFLGQAIELKSEFMLKK